MNCCSGDAMCCKNKSKEDTTKEIHDNTCFVDMLKNEQTKEVNENNKGK